VDGAVRHGARLCLCLCWCLGGLAAGRPINTSGVGRERYVGYFLILKIV